MLFIAFKVYSEEKSNPGFPDNLPSSCYEVDALSQEEAAAANPGLHVMDRPSFEAYLSGIRQVCASQIKDAQVAALQPAAWYAFWR